jgi:Cysteine-rich secretory protein family
MWKLATFGLAVALGAPAAFAQPYSYSPAPINEQAIIAEVLGRHNAERRRAGVPPLKWDFALADGARAYANELARSNVLRHSPRTGRRGIGENLWKGTRDYYRPTVMVGAWASERSMFQAAHFPNVSTTGNWADVGHYTQMIWPGTQRVGCAIAKAPRSDVLVCRYWPSGNIDGHFVP